MILIKGHEVIKLKKNIKGYSDNASINSKNNFVQTSMQIFEI